MDIEIDPNWSLAGPPDTLPLTAEGAYQFGGRVGDLVLPEDYLAFLRLHNGGALRSGRSWFLAHFADGSRKMQIDWLGNTINIQNASAVSFAPDGSGQNYLPPGFVSIGYAEMDEANIFIKADPSAQDHGHVFAWFYAPQEWMTGDNTEGLGPIADSFTAFMNGLQTEDAL